jgi:hypothetical protein
MRADVVLADRAFSGWFDIALALERGVDYVVRKHQLRATDFRTGQRLARTFHSASGGYRCFVREMWVIGR